MFFERIEQIPEIAIKNGCAIFVVPRNVSIKEVLPRALFLTPDERSISVAKVREFAGLVAAKQITDQFLVIEPAESMGDAAQNAFLKNLEEPQEKVHYVLITHNPTALLPTILSRAALFYLKNTNYLDKSPDVTEDIKQAAKQLMTATATNLPALATSIAKHKEARGYALAVVETAIELFYKSYFKTGDMRFLAKLPKFVTLYDNLAANGHVKLHLIADLC